MKKSVILWVGWLLAFLWIGNADIWAQDAGDYYTIVGMVKDKQNRKTLENVNVSVQGSNIGTVTNAEGEFALKVKKEEVPRELEISHIGYINSHVSLDKHNASKLTVWMIPHTNQLNEVVVYANNPRTIIEKAMEKIPVNYSANQKGRRYISVSEAVLDVSKTAYTNRTTDDDKLQVLKGRRLLSQKASDTLAVKVMGGPNISVVLDIVKNKEALLELEELNNYEFWMSESALIDNRIQYVINFRPRVLLPYALFHGKLYVDCDNLSFTRVEMDLDMQNKSKAIAAILHQKPLGLRFKPQELSFLITYKTIDGRTYMNYIRNDIRFKCDWKRRLFSTNYAVTSEMVVTDRRENPSEMIPRNKVFASNQIFYDKVGNYWSEDFWGNYNIIEPTESLEHAVDKLKKQSN